MFLFYCVLLPYPTHPRVFQDPPGWLRRTTMDGDFVHARLDSWACAHPAPVRYLAVPYSETSPWYTRHSAGAFLAIRARVHTSTPPRRQNVPAAVRLFYCFTVLFREDDWSCCRRDAPPRRIDQCRPGWTVGRRLRGWVAQGVSSLWYVDLLLFLSWRIFGKMCHPCSISSIYTF